MGKPTGFLEIGREKPERRAVNERVRDWLEFENPLSETQLRAQSSRCMDCGVPFCHQGCPLGNNIPEWNDLVYRGRWRQASESLHATNNFPEFTGRTCPAPCEEACVLNLSHEPVTIKHIEQQIVDRAFESGWVSPQRAPERTNKRVAVVGSGPAGLATAQQLARSGHDVTVFEKADRIGGLLRYGIPDFKLEKHAIDRRVAQMESEGVTFRTGIDVGTDVSVDDLRARFHAVCVATGARRARDLDVPGRELRGIHFAMTYLEQANRVVAGESLASAISADGKRVVILGGGDTGADCLGTAHRQRALSVHQFELLPIPSLERTSDMPWPSWPMILRTSAAHEEGGVRDYSVATKSFSGDATGSVCALHGVRVQPSTREDGTRHLAERPDSGFAIEADLVLLALGFTGAEQSPLLAGLGLTRDCRGNLEVDGSIPGVFTCGDARRGASLVVWAIREGRDAAARIDTWLRSGA